MVSTAYYWTSHNHNNNRFSFQLLLVFAHTNFTVSAKFTSLPKQTSSTIELGTHFVQVFVLFNNLH